MPSQISYLDETWNPISGCTPCSPGCENCWARKMAQRFKDKFPGALEGPMWHPLRLDQPYHWRKPRRIGVVFTGDLFHPRAIAQGWTQQVCGVIQNPSLVRHRFLTLTKRASIAHDYLNHWGGILPPQTYFGVSVENQETAEVRIPELAHFSLKRRWVSAEPLLGPLDLREWIGANCGRGGSIDIIDWVVVGCEQAGTHTRECRIEWVEDLVRQCRDACVPVYVKQVQIDGKVVHDIERFPRSVRYRQFPLGLQL